MRAKAVDVLLVMPEGIFGNRVERKPGAHTWLALHLTDEESGHLVIGHPAGLGSGVEVADVPEGAELEIRLFLDAPREPLLVRLAVEDVPSNHVPALVVRILTVPHEDFLRAISTRTHECLLGRDERQDGEEAFEDLSPRSLPANLGLELEVEIPLLVAEFGYLWLHYYLLCLCCFPRLGNHFISTRSGKYHTTIY